MDLQRHEGTVKDIILVAQGEMALEEFLKQVRPRSSQVNPGLGSCMMELTNIHHLCSGQGDVEHVRAGPDQLPEQVQDHPGVGRPVQQAQGEHQPGGGHEAVPLLQGENSIFR